MAGAVAADDLTVRTTTGPTLWSVEVSGIGVRLPSPLQELHDDRLGSVRVLLKRDDVIHPTVTGNKWRKLRYLLPAITASGATGVLTFGGGQRVNAHAPESTANSRSGPSHRPRIERPVGSSTSCITP